MRWQDRYLELLRQRQNEFRDSTLGDSERDLQVFIISLLTSIDVRLQILLERGDDS